MKRGGIIPLSNTKRLIYDEFVYCYYGAIGIVLAETADMIYKLDLYFPQRTREL